MCKLAATVGVREISSHMHITLLSLPGCMFLGLDDAQNVMHHAHHKNATMQDNSRKHDTAGVTEAQGPLSCGSRIIRVFNGRPTAKRATVRSRVTRLKLGVMSP